MSCLRCGHRDIHIDQTICETCSSRLEDLRLLDQHRSAARFVGQQTEIERHLLHPQVGSFADRKARFDRPPLGMALIPVLSLLMMVGFTALLISLRGRWPAGFEHPWVQPLFSVLWIFPFGLGVLILFTGLAWWRFRRSPVIRRVGRYQYGGGGIKERNRKWRALDGFFASSFVLSSHEGC